MHALEKEMATHSSILPGESQGQGSQGATVYGVAQSDTTEVTYKQQQQHETIDYKR